MSGLASVGGCFGGANYILCLNCWLSITNQPISGYFFKDFPLLGQTAKRATIFYGMILSPRQKRIAYQIGKQARGPIGANAPVVSVFKNTLLDSCNLSSKFPTEFE